MTPGRRYSFLVARGILRFLAVLAAMFFLAGRLSDWQAWSCAQEAVQDRQGVGRAAGDVEINGNRAVRAVVLFGMAGERTAGDGARADGDHEPGGRRGFVGLLQGQPHVLGDGTGDEQAVGVPRRGRHLDAEAAQVEDHRAERVDVGLAGVAAACADLPQLQRADAALQDEPLRAPVD